MAKYTLVYHIGVQTSNSLTTSLAAYAKRLLEEFPNLSYDGLDSIEQKILGKQFDLRQNMPYSRCQKIHVHKWLGKTNNPCMALFSNYRVYTQSKGSFFEIYGKEVKEAS